MIKIVAGRIERGQGYVDFRTARTAVDGAEYVDEDEIFHYSHRQQKNHEVYTDVITNIPLHQLSGDLVDNLHDIVSLAETDLAKKKLRIQKPKSGGVFDFINLDQPIAQMADSSLSTNSKKISATPHRKSSTSSIGSPMEIESMSRKLSTESSVAQQSLAAAATLQLGNPSSIGVDVSLLSNANSSPSLLNDSMLESMLLQQSIHGLGTQSQPHSTQSQSNFSTLGLSGLNAFTPNNTQLMAQYLQLLQNNTNSANSGSTTPNQNQNALLMSALLSTNNPLNSLSGIQSPLISANSWFNNANNSNSEQNLFLLLQQQKQQQQQQQQQLLQRLQQMQQLSELQQLQQKLNSIQNNPFSSLGTMTSTTTSTSSSSSSSSPTPMTKKRKMEDTDGNISDDSDDSFELAAKALSGLSKAVQPTKKAKTEHQPQQPDDKQRVSQQTDS
eukprot:TRINITY_DN484_c1_g2_i1.p1 TRINITY_DN484_c1_g2~~TRINITY_DN484_c1_g2_i1.p1  ORF type:complete len:443 (-),score=115.43 TRINITY_DN484_c1_g2_i1:36-1364(-)